MSAKKLVVAGAQPWTRKVYEDVCRIVPGEWQYVTNAQELADVSASGPRWIFVCHWHWMIPKRIWSQIETVNMHAAPLPWGRGGNIIEHHLLLGHTETVITAHRVDAALDSGDIYGTRGPVSLVRHIAKPDTWFDVGTTAVRLCEVVPQQTSLYDGIRHGHPDEEVCGDDEFDVQPCRTKVEILDRFVQPCVDLICWMAETEPEPYPQVGEVVKFARLPKDAYEKFWEGRQ